MARSKTARDHTARDIAAAPGCKGRDTAPWSASERADEDAILGGVGHHAERVLPAGGGHAVVAAPKCAPVKL